MGGGISGTVVVAAVDVGGGLYEAVGVSLSFGGADPLTGGFDFVMIKGQ